MDTANPLDVTAALRERRSVRSFLPDAIPGATVEAVLPQAARSPIAGNTQPWRVYACAGEVRDRLVASLLAAHAADDASDAHIEDYRYYPSEWQEPYLGRRRQVGQDLYRLLGIGRGDAGARARQYGRNYAFFAGSTARRRGSTWACIYTA